MAKESFYEQMKRLGLWDKPIGELANVIDEKDKAIAEKDKEIARLRNSHEMKFVRHIEAHLSAYQVTICKICGKDIFEISEEDSDG
jgi:rubrerythrin